MGVTRTIDISRLVSERCVFAGLSKESQYHSSQKGARMFLALIWRSYNLLIQNWCLFLKYNLVTLNSYPIIINRYNTTRGMKHINTFTFFK